MCFCKQTHNFFNIISGFVPLFFFFFCKKAPSVHLA